MIHFLLVTLMLIDHTHHVLEMRNPFDASVDGL